MNKLWITIGAGMVLILLGLFPLLIKFNVMGSNPLGFVSGGVRLLIIAFAALWLAIDARKEAGLLKRATEIGALVMVVFLAVPALNMVGVAVSLPGFLLSVEIMYL